MFTQINFIGMPALLLKAAVSLYHTHMWEIEVRFSAFYAPQTQINYRRR